MDLLNAKAGAKVLLSTTQAVARGVLEAGAHVVTGYPGTPATDMVESLLPVSKQAGVYIEWSVNEKVAFEIATGVSWAGQRAIVAMKMSGLNVIADSLLSVAHSGSRGGLVIFVTDDVGASCGMVEQDSRYYAQLAALPMLDIANTKEAKAMTRSAFEISERAGCPIFLRCTNDVVTATGEVQFEPLRSIRPQSRFARNLAKYTKAKAQWCLDQHQAALQRLEAAADLADEFNELYLMGSKYGVVASGISWQYLRELRARFDLELSLLKVGLVHPIPEEKLSKLMEGVEQLLILEELEPILEVQVRALSAQLGRRIPVLGKQSGLLPRVGGYSVDQVRCAVEALLGAELTRPRMQMSERVEPDAELPGYNGEIGEIEEIEDDIGARPSFSFSGTLTFCAGCPHRGTYYALNTALKQLGLDAKEVITTGDVGCTIIGMNPPFETCWTEVSMGASVGLAQGFVRAGSKEPVIATIGDGTFFHAGIPPLINAVSGGVDLTVIILDNEWTAMTGLQPSASTGLTAMGEKVKPINIVQVVEGLGVPFVRQVDPYDLGQTTQGIVEAIRFPGPAVVVAKRTCVIPLRRIGFPQVAQVSSDRCIGVAKCKPSCIDVLGCPAFLVENGKMKIDAVQCTGCGMCLSVCPKQVIAKIAVWPRR